MAVLRHTGWQPLPDVSASGAAETLALMRELERRVVNAESSGDFVSTLWCALVGALGSDSGDSTNADDLLPSEMWARYRERRGDFEELPAMVEASKLRVLAADWRRRSRTARSWADNPRSSAATKSAFDSESVILVFCANELDALLNDEEETG